MRRHCWFSVDKVYLENMLCYYHTIGENVQPDWLSTIIRKNCGETGVFIKYFKASFRGLFLLLLYSTSVMAAEDESHWWDNFSITPGAGFRHLGVDVIRKSDRFHGNISNAGFAQLVFSLNIVFNEFQIDDDGKVFIELNTYTSFIDLDHQFYETGSNGNSNFGERVDVGTSLSGYYTYLMPSLKYGLKLPKGGEMSASLGIGFWSSEFSGDMILTPDGRPVNGMPITDLSISTIDELAYMVNLKWQTADGWLYMMSVGGTSFSDDQYEYDIEEVSMIVGKVVYF